MRIGQKQSPTPKPFLTINIKAVCSKCDYWCEYEVDVDWQEKYNNKENVWYSARGHISLAACGSCGTIFCEQHSNHSNYMHCPECGSTKARMAMFQVLLDGNY